MNTCIIIVNWNGHEDCILCLESLLNLKNQDFKVIIVDNGSTDGSANYIRQWCNGQITIGSDFDASPVPLIERRRNPTLAPPSAKFCESRDFLTIIEAGSNGGFASANNIGIRYALEDPEIENIWLLNNDTVVDPWCLDKFLTRIEKDHHIGILGATLLYWHNPNLIQGVGAVYDPFWGRGYHIGALHDSDKLPCKNEVEAKMSYVIGASMFVSRKFIETVGLMNEKYFLYMEEMDWAIRSTQLGYSIGWVPEAVVYHKEGATIGTSQLGRPSDTSIYFQSINALRFSKLYFPLYLFTNFLRLLAVIARFVIRHDFKAASVASAAIVDFLTGRVVRGPIKKVKFCRVTTK